MFGAARESCGAAQAEDVTQEVFLQYWNNPWQFDATKGSLKNFLVMIARHKAITMMRSDDNRRAREARTSKQHQTVVQPEVDVGVLQRDQTAVIADALNRLPPAERDSLRQAFYGNLTYRQVATVLNQPEGTTKARIRSGLRRLRLALAEE